METPKKQEAQNKSWDSMKVTKVGHVGDVLQGGGGKLSPVGGDPGENKKQKPTG